MRSQFRAILASDFILAGSRLAFVVLIINGPWQTAIAATASVGIAQWLQFRYVRSITHAQIPWSSGNPNPDRRAIWETIRQFSPNSVFACVQGALAPWLIGFFANVEAVADLGALTRFAIVFSIIGSPINQIVGPGYARCQAKSRLIQLTIQIIGAFLLLSGGIVAVAAVFPRLFLTILGPGYGHLEAELFAVVCMQALSAANQLLWGLVMARGWVKYAWVQIPTAIICQVTALAFFDPSQISGVVFLAIAATIAQILIGTSLLIRGLADLSIPDETIEEN